MVLARIVRRVHAATTRGERHSGRPLDHSMQDFEHRGRIRRAYERGELAIDRKQRRGHRQRLEQRDRGGERGQLVAAVRRGGERFQAGVEVEPGRVCVGEQADVRERRGDGAARAVANLERVADEATLAGSVDGLTPLAPLDLVTSCVAGEQGLLEPPPHRCFVEGVLHAGQFVAKRPGPARIERVDRGVHRRSARRPAGASIRSASTNRLACSEA